MALDYSEMESKKKFKDEILAKLGTMKKGINSLQKTYHEDASFVSKLETLKMTIDDKLGEYIDE